MQKLTYHEFMMLRRHSMPATDQLTGATLIPRRLMELADGLDWLIVDAFRVDSAVPTWIVEIRDGANCDLYLELWFEEESESLVLVYLDPTDDESEVPSRTAGK